MDFKEPDFDQLKLEQEAQEKKKRLNSFMGHIADNLSSETTVGHYMLGRVPQKNTSNAQLAEKENAAMVDPYERGKKQMETLERYRQAKLGKQQDDVSLRENDINSQESKIANELAAKMGYKGAPLTAAQFKTSSPTMTKMYDIENDRLNRQESRDERRFQNGIKMDERKLNREEKERKEADLSAGEAKQMGLYNSGLKAEQQYLKAIDNKDEYDPTGSGQWIDNSDWAPNLLKNNKAIEAQNAQAAWIESFLRDASGAAIPPSERGAYAKDFFPQPGDTDAVVQNKAELRKQKMENALLGAGRTGREQLAKTKAQPPAIDEIASVEEKARQILEKRKKQVKRK